MITAEEYARAVRHAQNQVGPVVADIICRTHEKRIGNVSARPRGLYLGSTLEDMSVFGIEKILDARDTGKSYEHLTPDGWNAEMIERTIAFITQAPDYQPRANRIEAGTRVLHALLDLLPEDLPAEQYKVTVLAQHTGRSPLTAARFVRLLTPREDAFVSLCRLRARASWMRSVF